MPSLYMTCKHRWSKLHAAHFDRKHWIELVRCRKCDVQEQREYITAEFNGKVETRVTISPITRIELNSEQNGTSRENGSTATS